MRTAVAVVLAVFLMAGCGGDDGQSDGQSDGVSDSASQTTIDETTTGDTEADGPPCFGLEQVEELPAWAGTVDFTVVVGCQFDGGVLLVNEELGRAIGAYVDDCGSFQASDIRPELRPGAEDNWVCHQPTPDGDAAIIVPRQG